MLTFNQVCGYIKGQWQSVPIGTKFIVVLCLSLYLIDLLIDDFIFKLFCDIPYITLDGQVQRILLQEFVHGQLYNIIISLLSFYFSAIEFEKQIGTIAFILDILLKNVIIQVIYISLCFGLSFAFSDFLSFPSFGLWNVTMVYLTNRSLINPDSQTLLLFNYTVKAKYCPFFIIIFLNIFEFPRIDLIAGILVGCIEYRFFDGVLLRPSNVSSLKKIEELIFIRTYSSRQDFITADLNQNCFFRSDSYRDEQTDIANIEIGKVQMDSGFGEAVETESKQTDVSIELKQIMLTE